MPRQLALKTFSTFIAALMALTLVAPNTAQAAGKWDGEWVGKIALEKNSSVCRGKISVLSANIRNDEFNFRLKSMNKIHEIKAKISPDKSFNEWANLTVHVTTPSFSEIRTEEYNFVGSFEGNEIIGNLNKSWGTVGGDICFGSLNFAKSGTIEAKALMTGQDPEILKLEQQAALLNQKKSPTKGGKWDGEWVGKIEFDSESKKDCGMVVELKSLAVNQRKIHLIIRDKSGHTTTLESEVKNDNIFDLEHDLPTEVKYSIEVHNGTYKINGKFEKNMIFGSFAADNNSYRAAASYNCTGNLILARTGSIEAKAITTGNIPDISELKGSIEAVAYLTGKDPETLRLEKQVTDLSTTGKLRRVAAKTKTPVDPSKPYDGTWVGVVKDDDEGTCRFDGKLKEISIRNFEAELKFSRKSVTTGVSKSGELSKWLRLGFYLARTGTTESVDSKLVGSFSKDAFEGTLSADRGFNNTCTATVELGRKGSLHAEALITGKDPKLLALQRQIEAAQSAPANDNNEAARAEAEKITQQRQAEEKHLAALREEQAQARKAELERLATLRADQAKLREAEEKRLAERRAIENKRLAEQRAAEEKRMAAVRAEEQKRQVERQKAEEKRLAALRAEQEQARKAEQKRLTAKRAAEEKRIAAVRADEQKRQAERQKAEEARLVKQRAEQKRQVELAAKRQAEAEARLAKLEAQAKAKTQQLAALQKQQAAKPKSNIPANIKFGNYHALVIGIDNYKNLKPLKTAVSDAKAIAKVLTDNYGFKVTKLINPSHEDILDTLDELRETLKFKDNLLIYYAGHGWLDKEGDEGYWLPANAKKSRRSRWVSNASITTTLRALKAKHVMVMADSCYSGRLVRDAGVKIKNADTPEYFKQMSRKKARVVITSGGLEPVEDGKGEHSPFARAFLKTLSENKGVIDGAKLFNTIRRPVMVEANQTPQYSDVRRAGHDGGDFLFVRRQ